MLINNKKTKGDQYISLNTYLWIKWTLKKRTINTENDTPMFKHMPSTFRNTRISSFFCGIDKLSNTSKEDEMAADIRIRNVLRVLPDENIVFDSKNTVTPLKI